MTPLQSKFYFRLWNAACKANEWRMQNCRLQNADPEAGRSDMATAVLSAAAQLAAAEHRGVQLNDLRHAVHIAAVNRNCGHDDISTKQFGRVKALLQLLINPDDLAAMNEWLHPELDQRRQAIGRIRQVPYAYAAAISKQRFGTANWESLNDHDLYQLAMTTSARNRSHQSNKSHQSDPY